MATMTEPTRTTGESAEARAAHESAVGEHITTLYRSARDVMKDMAHRLHPDLQPMGYGVLRVIMAAESGARAGDIAQQLGMDKSAVSRQVAFLREVGLVDIAPDPLDGRASVITPSAAAVRILDEYRDTVHERYEQVFQDWSTADIARLAELLGRFVGDVERVQ